MITPPQLDAGAFAAALDAALSGGDVACVQLRLPDADDAALDRAARALLPLCHARDAALVVDRRAGVAAGAGADGVHVAGADAVRAARRTLGPDAIVGAECGGSRHAAMVAGEAGCDYVSFGPVHPSPTVPDARPVGTDLVAWWAELMEIACVAVGGITAENCAPVVRAGADFVAVSSFVWRHPEGPAAAVAALDAAIERAASS